MTIRTTLSISLLAMAHLLGGCAALDFEPKREHIVAVSDEGKLKSFRPSRPGAPARVLVAQTEANESVSPTKYNAYFSNMLWHIERRGRTNIIIFAQGGLNDIEDGIRRADRLTDEILADGSYPIFLAWNASLFSTYADHLYRIRRGREGGTWGYLTAPIYGAADLGRIATRSPVTWFHQGESDWKGVFLYGSPYRTNCEDSRLDWLLPSVKEVNDASCRTADRFSGSVTMRGVTTNRLLNIRDVASFWVTYPFKLVAAPIVDTAGKSAWDMMLRRTETMYVTPGRFEVGAMEYFARHLANFLRTNQNRYQVTLVGHSMGTIILNELVRRHGADLHVSNIVYMAAACGVDDFNRSIAPYLRSSPGTRFYNLTLHPQNDARETHYSFYELAPRGSLLEWIDQFYSSRTTDFGRTLGKWDNVVLALKGLDADVQSQMTVKAFGLGTIDQQGPQHHGDFSEMKFWRRELWEPLTWDPSLRQGR